MKKNSTKMICFCIMIISTIMVTTSNNWINMWLGLEMNLMAFAPLMYEYKNNFLAQASMSYFLIQSMASVIFLMVILQKSSNFTSLPDNYAHNIIMISMMMKSGLPPFQSWMPQVMENIKWETMFIMMTWQKIAPFYIMSMLKMTTISSILIIASIMGGALMGLNQTSMRKIMAYSSMTHGGWIMASMKTSSKIWVSYMMLYSMIMIMLCSFCAIKNIININQMSLFNIKLSEKMILIMLMLSMGGLPPFMGFIPKWMVLNELVNSKESMMILLMLLMNLITLFYYIRMTTSLNLLVNTSQKWMIPLKPYKNLNYMMIVNILTPVLILIINFD